MEDPYFSKILNLVHSRTGLELRNYKISYLIRRIKTRLRKTGKLSFQEYYIYSLQEPKEVQYLIDAIGINISRFYRNYEVFEKIKQIVLPEFRNVNYLLRLWSAGCATGEEAYTMAILFTEEKIKNFFILGTDVDEETLEKARMGVYNSFSMQEVPQYIKMKYFTFNNDRYTVINEIKERITFKKHNLFYPLNEKNKFDIILCRNVLIYFERKIQEQVVHNLVNSLKKGGIMVLGKVENLPPSLFEKMETIDIRERIYRLKE